MSRSVCGSLSWCIVAVCLAAPGPAFAATISANGTSCLLRDAIVAANTDSATNGCPAGNGADRIELSYDVTLTTADLGSTLMAVHSGLPDVSSNVTIVGVGIQKVITRDIALDCDSTTATAFRLLAITGGNVRLENLALNHGCVVDATGSNAYGGAVLVPGGVPTVLTVSGCQFYKNDVWSPLTARGAAIASTGAGLVIGGNSEFHFNSARGYTDGGGVGGFAAGGAVFVDGFGPPPVITDAYFHDNVAISGDSDQSAGAVAYGGAILITSAAATLDRLRVVHNLAQGGAAGDGFGSGAALGGGILVFGGSLAHSIVSQNRAAGGDDPQDDTGGLAQGGGVMSAGAADLNLTDVLFDGNMAVGGASTGFFAGNAQGGGLELEPGGSTQMVISGCTFKNNLARGGLASAGGFAGFAQGGGMYSSSLTDLINSTFVANTAQGGDGPIGTGGNGTGGAIFQSGTGALRHLRSTTIVGNIGRGGANGIGGVGGFFGGTVQHLADTIMADNSSIPDGSLGDVDCHSNALTSDGYNLIRTSATCTLTSTDIPGLSPGAGILDDHGCTAPHRLPDGSCIPTWSLEGASPAVDTGSCATSTLFTDQRGFPRPTDDPFLANDDDGCDIGAFERFGIFLQLAVHESADPVLLGASPVPLSYMLTLTNQGTDVATNITVHPTLTLPTGVTFQSAAPSNGAWNGTDWTLPTLPAGDTEGLVIHLSVAPITATGTDVVACNAAVTAVDQPNAGGVLPTDGEATSVRTVGVFANGFEPLDPAWDFIGPP